MKLNNQLYPQVESDIKFKLFPRSEVTLSSITGNKILTGAAFKVYELCNGTLSIEDIHKILCERYEITIDSLSTFIGEAENLGYLRLLNQPEHKEIVTTGSIEYSTPQGASIILTDKCNLSCSYCYGHYSPNGKIYLSISQINELYDKLLRLGVEAIELSGGEPLMNPDFNQILLKSLECFKAVTILSNGVLFTDKIINILRNSNRIVFVQISIDGGSEETNAKVRRVNNTWEKTLSNIKKIVRNKINLRVVYMLTHENKNELLETFKLMKDVGVKHMAITIADGMGRGASLKNPDSTSLTNRESSYFSDFEELIRLAYNDYKDILINDALEKYSEMNFKYDNCGAGWKLIVVEPNGNINACQMLGKMSNLGNIFTERYEDMAKRNMMRFFQEFSKSKDDHYCQSCEYKTYCNSCIARIIYANIDRKKKGNGLCNIASKYSLDEVFEFENHLDFNI